MPNTFFISDTHFGHANIINFKRRDGSPLRAFDCVEDMDETMVSNWNNVVSDKDSVWHLGDVVINRKSLSIIQRLNGRKRLVLGNHDIFKNKDYLNAGFEDFHAFKKFDDFVCTHIPVHSGSLGRWGKNVHGHTHADRVRLPRGADARTGEVLYSDSSDPNYYCVSVEQINYTPISIEDLRLKLNGPTR